MKKSVIFALAAVVVLGLGVFVFAGISKDGSNNNSDQVATDAVSGNGSQIEVAATISYTDSGFEPANQDVVAGQTVRFVNNSSVSMWVASDDHPTHTDYPEFDSKQGVGPGETYDFTFEEVGKWGYHDHLNDEFKGSITVTKN
jgi:plastocyanin